jgi:hypothetical protein
MTRDYQALTASAVDGTQDEHEVRAIADLVIQAIGWTDHREP